MIELKEIGYGKRIAIIVGLLMVFGIVAVFSASYIYSKEMYNDSALLFKKQLLFVVLGMGVIFIVSKTKFSFWFKYLYYFHIFNLFLLTLTLIPGVGISVNGAMRWVSYSGISFQPGEIVKFSLLLVSIYFFEYFFKLDVKKRFFHILLFIYPMVIFFMQPDFGTFGICFFVMVYSCFLSSFPRKLFYSFVSVGTVFVFIFLITAPYRMQRLLTFLDPWKDPQNAGFQLIQSYLAFASGHIFGKGLGNGNEKLFYLPEAHNDFILSVIGEELGLLGILFVIALFLLLLFYGLKASLAVKNKIVAMTVASLIFSICLQAFFNMAVVLGVIPTKGLNLPFISCGGSSMLANCFAIGLLLSSLRSNEVTLPYWKSFDFSQIISLFSRFKNLISFHKK